MKLIKQDNGALLTVDEAEMAQLLLMRIDEPETWGTTQCESEVIESFLCNSEWDWIDPSETGDLTDAPMIGIRSYDEKGDIMGEVIERYAFMSYALRSFLDDLADDGVAFFHGGAIATTQQ